jgi:hypothetical protein
MNSDGLFRARVLCRVECRNFYQMRVFKSGAAVFSVTLFSIPRL